MIKKSNLLLGAAVAGLFSVSAHASAKKVAAPDNEKDCMEQKMVWKDGMCTSDAHSCAGKAMKKTDSSNGKNGCGANGCNAPESTEPTPPKK